MRLAVSSRSFTGFLHDSALGTSQLGLDLPQPLELSAPTYRDLVTDSETAVSHSVSQYCLPVHLMSFLLLIYVHLHVLAGKVSFHIELNLHPECDNSNF